MTPATFALIGKVLAAVALVALVGKGVTSCQEHYREQGRTEVKAEWEKAVQAQEKADATANQTHRQTEGKDRAQVSTAQNQRAQTAGADVAAAAGMRAERDGLRRDLTTALNTIRSCSLPGPAADAAASHTATVESVFNDVESEGEGMAGAASGHAADSLMYQQAWPQR